MNYLELLFNKEELGTLKNFYEQGLRDMYEDFEIDPFADNTWWEDNGRPFVKDKLPSSGKVLLKVLSLDLETYFIQNN